MSRGKHLSLEEARKSRAIERFSKEHPSEGSESAFDRLLAAMTGKKAGADQTSREEDDAC